ncbi:MAG TPA: GNAT family N-acetyltransferase [Gaiellaceae bacterium]|nr:GNAT family N-acetyltransferase [Gaiellaceae bacterium]
MAPRVEEIDARTAPEAELAAIHRVDEACSWERPFRTLAESVGQYRHWSDPVRRRWVARDGDDTVGTAVLMAPSPTFAAVHLVVHPDARRRGAGRALYEAVCAGAREEGIGTFFGHHWGDDGAAFARSAGAVDDQRDVASSLGLRDADLPEPTLPAGWRLLSWRGAAPAELVDSYARVRSAMEDAPTPGGLVYGALDADGVRALERTAAARGREPRVTVAIDEHGELGAFTDVRTSPAPSPVAGTDDTGTAPWARRQGLATAVKLESLRRLRAERPDVEVVRTMNAEGNTAMRAVNTRLGFVPTAFLTTTVITL